MSDNIDNEPTVEALKTSLGISEVEAKTLAVVLLGGNMTAGAISLLSSESIQTVETALTSLHGRGLVIRMEGVVPVYRGVSSVISATGNLEAAAHTVRSLADLTKSTHKTYDKDLASVTEGLVSSQEIFVTEIGNALDVHESAILQSMRSSTSSTVESVGQVFATFSQDVNSAFANLIESVDGSFIAGSSDLRSELDAIQKQLKTELDAISRELDQSVTVESSSSSQALTDYGKKWKALAQKTKSATKGVMENAVQGFHEAAREVAVQIDAASSEAANQAVADLAAVSQEADHIMQQFNAEIDQARDDAQNNLAALVAQARELSGDVARTARAKIEESLEAVSSVSADVDAWRKETGDFMNSASQTVLAQLDQVHSTNDGYLEGMKSGVSTYTERTGSMLGDAYSSAKDLTREMQSDLETRVGDCKASILKVVQNLSSSNQERLGITSDSLTSGLDKWAGDLGRNVEKKLAQASTEVRSALDAETKAFSSLTASLARRLGTALEGVASDTAGKNKSILTKTRKMGRESDADLGARLSETATQLTSLAGSQARDAKGLYESMNSLLDSYLAQSLSTLGSYSDKVQKQIEATIDEQMARIDNHAQAIQGNFHTQIEETTKQLLGSTENAQAAFNGMLSGHGLETRDSLSSAQTEFRNAIKAGTAELLETSLKLKQEYGSGIAAKVEQVTASHAAMKQSLEEIAIKRQSSLSESLADTVGAIEAVLADVEAMLEETRSTTKSSASASKTTSLLRKVRKLARQFEADMRAKLIEAASQLTSSAGSQAKQARGLYESMNSLLDTYLMQCVSALSSCSERVQKQIDDAIGEQMTRMDSHAQGMQVDFGARIEEITKQFVGSTENAEAAFNGMLSGQSLETRDSLSSAQTEFKNVIKAGLAELQESSLKLKQEYASGIAAEVEQVTVSHAAMKHSIEETAGERQSSLSQGLADTVSALEGVIAEVDARLKEVNAETVPQLTRELADASGGFSTSVGAACDGMMSRMESLVETTNDYATKSVNGLKTTIESFVAGQREADQGMVADAGKKLESLATKTTKDFSQRAESFLATLTDKEKEAIKTSAATEAELSSLLDSRKAEAERALATASTWIESTVNNILSTLAALGEKTNNGIAATHQGLVMAAEAAETGIVQKTTTSISQFEEAATTLIGTVESGFRNKATGFRASCEESVTRGIKSVSGLPTPLSKKVRSAMDQAESGIRQSNSGILDGLSEEVSAFEAASKAALDELSSEVVRFKEQLMKVRDSLQERTEASAETANRRVSEKTEAIMTDAKGMMSHSVQSLIDKLSGEAEGRNAAISESVNQLLIQAEADAFETKTSREETLSKFAEGVRTSLQRWSALERGQGTELANKVGEALAQVESTVVSSVETLKAVKKAAKEMEKVSSDKTWYLTGEEEMLAHISDMTQRAQESIVISTVSLSGLDIASLVKVPASVRRVLIVPEREEPDQILERLEGWRIWSVASPMLLAVMDDKEILIGGATEASPSLALLSKEDAYLQLYHDILGPRLTSQRRRTS